MTTPPVCDYEGSDYQTSFWEKGGRAYEDLSEAIALRAMLPKSGKLMLELGAGAGRNTPRYNGYERIVLLDYSRTQLQQARARLGDNPRYTYIAADIYKLPFIDSLFDGATMIRTLHHMKEAPQALAQVRRVLQPGATFILEYANKRNLKSILRYWLKQQSWNPFTPEQVEFVALNFDFHPRTVEKWMKELGFRINATRAVSHFRLGLLKQTIPPQLLSAMDGFFQPTGALWQLTPSIFLQTSLPPAETTPAPADLTTAFRCPECAAHPLQPNPDHLHCENCGRDWGMSDGIYDFREAKTA
jgi:ubiquinone/menaquinone biosynthesis C-methylase UbiE